MCNVKTLARVLNCISLERASLRNSNKMCVICMADIYRKIWTSILCDNIHNMLHVFHILTHISTPRLHTCSIIQTPHTLSEC